MTLSRPQAAASSLASRPPVSPSPVCLHTGPRSAPILLPCSQLCCGSLLPSRQRPHSSAFLTPQHSAGLPRHPESLPGTTPPPAPYTHPFLPYCLGPIAIGQISTQLYWSEPCPGGVWFSVRRYRRALKQVQEPGDVHGHRHLPADWLWATPQPLWARVP